MPPGARSRALISSRQILATTYPTPRPPASVFRATLLRLALLAALAAFCCPAPSAQGIQVFPAEGYNYSTLTTDVAGFYWYQAFMAPEGGQGVFQCYAVQVDGSDSGVLAEVAFEDYTYVVNAYGPGWVIVLPYGETFSATEWWYDQGFPDPSYCSGVGAPDDDGWTSWTGSFTAASLGSLDYPTPGPGTILGTSNVEFDWDGGTGANQFYLYLGTTGPGSNDIYESGITSATSVTVPSIPANGATIYAELGSSFSTSIGGSGTWYPQDFVYTEFSPAVISSPSPGLTTVLGSSNVNFQWNAGNVPGEQFQLILGTEGPGSANLFNSGITSATSITVPTLPADGVTVFTTFGQQNNGTWQYGQYVYTESGSPTPADLTTPTPGPGTVLDPGNVTFQWTRGAGPALYELMLGTSGPGSADLFSSGGTAATSVTVPGIPADGVTVYARFWQLMDATWQYNDYIYTESGSPTPAELTTPTPGPSTVLGATDVTFQWTPGAGPTLYELRLGTSPGSANLFGTGGIRANSVTVPSIPSDGVTVYVRLLQRISGTWQYTDSVYTESGSPTPAVLTTPTPGLSTVLGTTNVTFQWTPGAGPTLYELRLGTIGPGSGNLFSSGGIRATSLTVPTLPDKGAKVYATLYQQISGVWHTTTYEYTESPP